MATIKPFAAVRPRPELAVRLCTLPYDVLSSDEARELAAGNPFSFLRVSKPEIDLPATHNPYEPEVYEKGKRTLARFLSEGWLRQDAQPGFYLYRQTVKRHCQTGVVAVVSCEEYQRNLIRRHELTKPEKEDDRVRHIEALNAQTGPAFLFYRADAAIDSFVARRTAAGPEIDFTAPDGVRHCSWSLHAEPDLAFLQSAFERIRFLYIADGHHRAAAAVRVFQNRQGSGNSRYFLTVLFPHNQLRILPYHRLLRDLHGLTPPQLLERLAAVCHLQENAAPTPPGPHQISLFVEGRWYGLTFHAPLAAASDLIEQLDVALLQRHILKPIFGLADPRTSDRLCFIGGVRGTRDLEKRVASGEFACGFSLHPTRIEDLMAIADAGEMMPPKSTWFEPKLRDAMFCHLL
ncbi:MAG: DUF1015 domain-containing protein [Verrucomicrobia bacterium]|nr:DUF1015 domain-containing protein [Verrucomicrobiota bacterium]